MTVVDRRTSPNRDHREDGVSSPVAVKGAGNGDGRSSASSTVPVAPQSAEEPPRQAPSLVHAQKYTDREIYKRVLGEARRYWGHIGAIFLISLLATPIALLEPLSLKIAVDSVLDDKPLPGFLEGVVPASLQGSSTGLLVFAVLLLVTVELFSQLQSLSTRMLTTYTSERLTLGFRAKVFRHAQRLSMSYHDRKGTADANYRIQSDAAAISNVAVSGVIPFVSSAFTFVMMLVIIAGIDLSLALIALIVTPVLAGLTWGYRRRLRARHREVKALESSALAVVQEVLTSLRIVKAFGQEEREERRFTDRAAEGTRARLRVAVVDGSFWVAISLVTALGTGAVLFVGVRGVQSEALTLGSLLLVISYLGRLYGPLYTVSSQVASLQSGFASAERVLTLLDEEPDVVERPDARPLHRAHGDVEFRGISFSYLDGQPVLEHISFRVEAGAKVGIAGRTGSGKTTLVNLLTRFYDPTDGVILLDGLDLRDYRVDDLRNQFSIVQQEPVLFSTTIGENIAYGRPDASFEEIVAAARAANVHDFVSALPDGYDTTVGERGMTMSGGERQRVSLARAFLKDAPILILDEPTSSVDVKTEATIIEAMERLMSGRTTFMIAHRLSTLEGCDLRIEIEAGKVVDETRPVKPVESASPVAAAGREPRLGLGAAQHALVSAGFPVDVSTHAEEVELNGKSSVHRVSWQAATSGSCIVKRCSDNGRERRFYTDLAPRLDVSTLGFYGSNEDDDGAVWLVLEDAGDTQPTLDSRASRTLLTEWAALLHLQALPLSGHGLPDAGPDHYRDRLEGARTHLARRLGTDEIDSEDREVLEQCLECCAELAGLWPWIEEVCARYPRTLVHGDLVEENLRVLSRADGPTLVALDWEKAGWGVPAVDLIRVEPELYWRLTRAWLGGTRAEFDQLLLVGRIFRTLVHRWAEKSVGKAQRAETRLSLLISEAAA